MNVDRVTCVSFKMFIIYNNDKYFILGVNFRVNFFLYIYFIQHRCRSLQNRETTNKLSKIQVDLVHLTRTLTTFPTFA